MSSKINAKKFIFIVLIGLSFVMLTFYISLRDLPLQYFSLNLIPHRLTRIAGMFGTFFHSDLTNTSDDEWRLKKILFWTPFFSNPDYGFGFGRRPFLDHNCTFTECETTNNRSEFNASHAVIVHMRNIRSPSRMPTFRFPWQYFVFLLAESPIHSLRMGAFNGMFNLTNTYRYDSDINGRYGYLVKKRPAKIPQKPFDYSKGKTKLVAWFVSNCHTQSHRRQYTNELQKYINVDIYGRCGPLKCSDREACYSMLEKNYKFYLSFENSICKDYATEKLWRVLGLNVVPIVLGGFEYKKYLPDHSFIDIRDYRSPSELGAYLRKLESNATLYNQYFEWKQYYKIDTKNHPICYLCEFLHTKVNFHKTYEHLDKWWNRDQDCIAPSEYFRGHANIS